MEKKKWFLLMMLMLLMLVMTKAAAAVDKLYEGFREPPAQARPFVRWWWNGNRVTVEETLRELDIMKQAGIGGFEMNTIGMPANASKESLESAKALTWLSPEWNQVVKATAKGARERGMIPDLIVGSGWPFGGRFLKSGEQIQIITVNKKELTGPGVFEGDSKKLAEAALTQSGGRRRRRIEVGSKPRLVFLRLVPADLAELQPGIDLMDKVAADGSVKFVIPSGKHILYTGAWREGFRHVARGGPGADGPVVDHLNKTSVEKYLNRMSDALNPVLDGKLGNYLRAMFCDSLELSHTNWTTDFKEQFKKRRGYDPDPYLHFMADLEPVKGDTKFHDALRRLRYDFNITVIELFMENFMQTFTEWCNRNGVKSRAQSYGRESHPLDTSFLVDIPECETWFRDADKKKPHPTMINRYVASAAHLAGKRLISCEAMTNPVTVFRILPKNIKATDDLNFISGTTHSVLHGFNYSPPEAGFPGWVQFGCYFSEQNPWWPYFRKWADYNARISYMLQNSDAQANVAIFSPDADIWSSYGRLYLPFPELTPVAWYIWTLWEALHQNGYNVEYTSDKILAQARFDGGKIHFGPRAYNILILEDVGTMLPETAKRLAEFAKAGGKIIFVGKAPYRSPSFKNAAENDEIVKNAIRDTLNANPKYVAVVPAPTEDNIVDWAGDIMDKFDVARDVKISSPNADLSQIYHKLGDRNIFFFAWTNTENPITFTAQFNTADKTPWQWDPETGARSAFPYDGSKNNLTIHLEPQESLLLVFEPDMTGQPGPRTLVDYENFVEVKPHWKVEFNHTVTGQTFRRQMTKLIDPGKSKEQELKTFAGTIAYRAEFDVTDTGYSMLNLGTVHGVSEVTLNGKPLGVRWYGRHTFDASAALKSGNNTIEVKVTTHLGNYVRSFKRNTPAGRWAWWFPTEPMGLHGPVRLCGTR